MAYTSAQEVDIRTYTGFTSGSSDNNTSLEDAIRRSGADADWSAKVIAVLSKIAAIEAEIDGGQGFMIMSKAEEVTVSPSAMRDLRRNGRRECLKLCSVLGIEIGRNVFSAGWRGGPMGMG